MGHEHIDSLRETKPSPSQERVGEVAKSEQMRNGADGQTEYVRTDVEAGAPLKLSYADMAIIGNQNKPESVKGGSSSSPLAFSLSWNDPVIA